MLRERQGAGRLTPKKFILETARHDQLTRRIGDSMVAYDRDLLVGFKWIARQSTKMGRPIHLRNEESHGYMAGDYVPQKMARSLHADLRIGDKLKAAGQTLHESSIRSFAAWCPRSSGRSMCKMPGSEGMTRMKEVMAAFRSHPPTEIGGVACPDRDYELETVNEVRWQTAAALAPKRRSRDARYDDRAITSPVAQRHRAKNQVLSLRLHSAEQLANLESAKAGARNASRGWKPTCGSLRAYNCTRAVSGVRKRWTA